MTSRQTPEQRAIEAAAAAEAEKEYREQQAETKFAAEVLKRTIDWEHLAAEGALSKREATALSTYEADDATARQVSLDEAGPFYAGMFIKILTNVRNTDTVEYTIILIDQLFAPERTSEQIQAAANYFIEYSKQNAASDIAAPFLAILDNAVYNPFVFLRIQHILAIIMAAAYGSPDSPMTENQRMRVVEFLQYLISKINHTLSSSGSAAAPASSSPMSPSAVAVSNRMLMACLNSIKTLLRSGTRMQELFASQDGIRAITSLLNKETQNAQLLYILGFNIWLLSYHKAIAMQLREYGVIKKLVQVVKVNVMEKVIRISFAILRNFLDHKVDAFNEDMIGHGLVPVLDTLSKRKFKDADIVNDMTRIQEVLAETVRNMSTFEKYSVEVMSGTLTWTNPAHKNEVFWRENINAFEANNFQLVAQLIALADTHPAGTHQGANAVEREETIREIACYDLGEFARFHPDGKKIVQKLHGKLILMKNLQDKSPKVSKAALLATQKLMVANWEFLNKSSSGGVASLVSQNKK